MRIQLLSGYRGKASQERFYEAGAYDADSMPVALMLYLVEGGYAVRLQDEVKHTLKVEPKAEPKPETPRRYALIGASA